MKNLLITGGNGFVGNTLCQHLLALGYKIRLALRSNRLEEVSALNSPEFCTVDSLNGDTNWSQAVKKVDTIIHLAARVHIMNDRAADPLAAFRQVNVEATKSLVEQAVAAKVKRFVFLSSLHVNGTNSNLKPFQETDPVNPQSPYAISKLEAEQYLNKVAKETNLEVVIVRPPLIYGPGVKANFLSMLNLIKGGLPLPVGALREKRSMIGLHNLVDFLSCCIEQPHASNQTFLISDDNDISVRDLFIKLAELMGKHKIFVTIPSKILYVLGSMAGKKNLVDRLCAPLQVNISKAKQQLHWLPKYTLNDGLKETMEWYKKKFC